MTVFKNYPNKQLHTFANFASVVLETWFTRAVVGAFEIEAISKCGITLVARTSKRTFVYVYNKHFKNNADSITSPL